MELYFKIKIINNLLIKFKILILMGSISNGFTYTSFSYDKNVALKFMTRDKKRCIVCVRITTMEKCKLDFKICK